jgi:hypothetical protein
MTYLQGAYPSLRDYTADRAGEIVDVWQDVFANIDFDPVMESVREFAAHSRSAFPPSASQIYAPILDKLRAAPQIASEDELGSRLWDAVAAVKEKGAESAAVYQTLPYALRLFLTRESFGEMDTTKNGAEIFRFVSGMYSEYAAIAEGIRMEMYVNGRSFEHVKGEIEAGGSIPRALPMPAAGEGKRHE